MTAGLLTAGSGHAWETELVAALDRPGAPFTVIRRCADLADVLAMASTGQAVAAVVSSDLRRLDSEAVSRLVGLGVVVLAVHRAGDARAPVRLGRVGIAVAIQDDAGSAAILDAVRALVHSDTSGSGSGSGGGSGSGFDGGSDSGFDGGSGGPAAGSDGPAVAGPDGESVAGTAGPSVRRANTGSDSPTNSSIGSPAPAGSTGSTGSTGSSGPTGPTSTTDVASPGASRSGGRLAWLRRRSAPAPDPTFSDPATALGPGRPGRDVRRDSAEPATGRAPTGGSAEPAGPAGPRSTVGADQTPERRAGTVIAVWGPNGAPGRSTVAMGIADEASAAGNVVLLIDADVYGGVLAAAFGLLDESPGLAGACRMASNGRLDGPTLAGLCWSVGPRWSLLTGIARADRWPEVRPSAIPMVLATARELADVVVVDCAAILETDEEISFDTMAPRRNGATLAVLGDADLVIAVGAGDPPGIERLVRGLAQLGDAVPEASPRVVVNRTRRTAASRREIEDAVYRFAGLDVVAQLPEDRDATDKAWRGCVGLSQAAPRSALRAGLSALTLALVPPRGEPALPVGSLAGPSPGESGPPDRSAVGVGAAEAAGRRRRGRHADADPE